jgi:hypothetical protein
MATAQPVYVFVLYILNDISIFRYDYSAYDYAYDANSVAAYPGYESYAAPSGYEGYTAPATYPTGELF